MQKQIRSEIVKPAMKEVINKRRRIIFSVVVVVDKTMSRICDQSAKKGKAHFIRSIG